MMIKTGKMGIKCTYCDAEALPDTEPPVCEEHKELRKEASAEATTLKELQNKGPE